MTGMARLSPSIRRAVHRQLEKVPAARTLRFRIATKSLERFARDRGSTLRRGLDVLDAGSGEGLLAERIAKRHRTWRIVACDLDEEQVARGVARTSGIQNLRFETHDLTEDLGTERYDVVLAIECLEEIHDDEAALVSMARALRRGGLFVSHLPMDTWTPVLRRSAPIWRNEVRHGYNTDSLRSRLSSLGLEVLSIRGSSRVPVRLAQELRDLVKSRSVKTQLAVLPVSTLAVAVERLGLGWGHPRALFVEAVKR
jgi:SAM-dependent methyltransferase